MPKFLSDLEVQGKINAASATINDLMVGKLEVSGGGDLCVDSITVEKDSTFKGSATFSYNPLFNEGFCITEAFTLRELDGLLVEKNGCSSKFIFFPDEDETTATVSGNFCVTDSLIVRGTACVAGLSVECTADIDRLNVGGPANFSCGANFCGDVCTCTFLADSAFVYCLNAVPLCGNTALGADAYGLSVSRDGGLQLWGTHFLQGSVWSDDTLKIVHNDLSLGATDKAFLGFDYANEVNFRTFPNDGTEATYCFVANQWQDDSHKYYKPAGVRLKKANQVSEISDEDVLNAGEGDQRWLCYDTILSCNTVNIITQLCSLNRNDSYGVLFGSVPICPLWVKGDACVQGRVNLRSPLGKYPEDEARLGFGVFDSSDCTLGLRTSQSFCLDVGEFGLAIGSSANSFEVNNGGANFSTCTTFNRDIYTKEKVYLTELPTYSGSAEPGNTSLVTKSYVDNRLSSVYSFKGTKAKVSDLNSITTKAKGDVYNVTEDGMNYAWDGTAWDALGGDFSRYYTKTEIDTKLGDYATNEAVYDRATIDGVDTGAEVLPKMNEIIGYLNDYEEKTGEKLPLELYEETVKAIEEWQKDPTVEKDWYRMTDSTTWESTSNCPYTDTVATSPIVDLSVKSTGANLAAYPCFNKGTDVVIFLPNATSTKVSVGSSGASFSKPFIAPNSAYWNYFAAWNYNYNMPTYMPKATDATEAFTSTGMSSENISKTLDSLPPYTSGKHVIKFTGSPGASELTQESPSVAAAVAKGWTVEL